MATLRDKPQSEARMAGNRPTMTRRAFAVGGLAVAGAIPGGCTPSYVFPWSWHQKITLRVQTPRGEVAAHTVQSIVWWSNFFSGGWGGPKFQQETIGEAVVLEVAPGKHLFLLMTPGDGKGDTSAFMADLATRVIHNTRDRAWGREAFDRAENAKGQVLTVPPKLYPLLVTFGDIQDPASVVEVKPGDLDKHFGPGFSFTSITLEITDEPVAVGSVEKVIPWILSLKGALVPSPMKDADKYTLPETLGSDDFFAGRRQ
jgi:hypothetical protein